MAESLPIILLSGMAADERLFESQRAAFPHLRVQPWPAPLPGESLRAYAARLAPRIDPGRPCIVGGASFGGVVALELAHHLSSARACILIGSIRSPAGLPWRWRLFRPFALFGPDALRIAASIGSRIGRHVLPRTTVRRLRRLAGPDAAFVRWSMCALMRWRPSAEVRRTRVFHIHGSADRVLPVSLAKPDQVVAGGAHALSLFSPQAVNAFIAGVERAVARM